MIQVRIQQLAPSQALSLLQWRGKEISIGQAKPRVGSTKRAEPGKRWDVHACTSFNCYMYSIYNYYCFGNRPVCLTCSPAFSR